MDILLVEDNPGDARLIREMLAKAGDSSFHLEHVDRLAQCLERLERGGIDAVLLDLGLPDSQGIETLRRVRARASAVPIVVLTSGDDEELALEAAEAGAQDYLAKGHVDYRALARVLHYATVRKRAEEDLERFFMLSLDMLCIAGFDGYVKRISPSCEKIFGFTPEEVRAQPFLSFVHPEEHVKWLAELQKLAAGGVTTAFESRARCRDGSYKWILWNAVADLTQGLVYAAGRDITERKEAELESQALLASIVQSSEDAIFAKNLEGTILSWNNGAEKMYGYPAGEAIGKAASMLIPPELGDEFRDLLAALRHGESVEGRETEGVRKDGRLISVSLTISPLRSPEGHVTAASVIARDITERKRAQEALRESEERLSLALKSAHVGTWSWNIAPDRIIWDDYIHPLFGLKPRTFGGKYEDFLRLVHADDRARVSAEVSACIGSDAEYDTEYRVVWPDGSLHFVGARGKVYRDREGCPVRMTGVCWDVTGRKRAEEEIKRLNENLERRVLERTAELQAANKDLEAFTYSVSHDLRAPLRHIDGFSKILVDEHAEQVGPEVLGYLERIRSGAQQMGRLVDDLLKLARVGRQDLARVMTGLNSIVEEVIEDLKPDVNGRVVEWRVGQLPSVECDPALMKQVFQNLLSNALKYTGPRQKAIIEVDQLIREGQPVVFVRDNGVGFNMKYAEKLFGVFQRLHRAEEFEGTGVGLATVQRIVHKHGGRIWAEAELGKGATFFFTIGSSDSGSGTAEPKANRQ